MPMLNKLLEDFRTTAGALSRWTYFDSPEILDVYADSSAARRRVHRDLERLARITGLYRMLLKEIKVILLDCKAPKIIDVCCGAGGFTHALADALVDADIVGVDLVRRETDTGGAEPQSRPRFEVGDARRLPYADRSFDLCVNLQSLHHFSADDVVAVVAEGLRIAHRIFFFDLRRTLYGPSFVRLWAPLMSREFIHDGVASHRRAYNVAELRFLLVETAGLAVRVRPFLPVGLVVEA